jgi:hypothetical protein
MMRFHTTTAFSTARAAWVGAYAAHDRAAGHEDTYQSDFARETVDASDLEYATLEAVLSMPASTPAEVGEKLRIMRERGVDDGWGDDRPRYLAQIERDLAELQRPCVSPVLANAFLKWRLAYASSVNQDVDFNDDGLTTILCENVGVAVVELMALPCSTPGDVLLKQYVDLLGANGATKIFDYEISVADLTEGLGTNDGAALESAYRDLAATDLGGCLLALGRVDFDANRWLAAAARAGVEVRLVRQSDGSRALHKTFNVARNRSAADIEPEIRCHRLLAGGGSAILANERIAAVLDAIEDTHQHLICGPMAAVEGGHRG